MYTMSSRGAVCMHCELLPMRKLSLWGSQVDFVNKLDKGLSLSLFLAGDESKLWDDDDVLQAY